MSTHYQGQHSRKKKKEQSAFRRFCGKPIGKYLFALLISVIAEASIILFLLYGPIDYFRELLITSSMTTFTHQYYARTFYSEETIQAVMKKNNIQELTGQTSVDEIKVNPDSNEIRVKRITGSGYTGYVMEISNPAWIIMGIPANFGTKGQKIPRLIEDYNAIAGINAGGFGDANGWGNGGKAIGLVVVDGVVLNETEHRGYAHLVGFTEDNVLVCGKYTTEEMEKLHLRCACEFTPVLIQNGVAAEISGNGGWGVAPRTAIGQRKDGTVLFVVIDGRSILSAGATMKQLQQVLIDEGAYNAANMDGGSSTVLYYTEKGGVMNNPSGSDSDGMRFLPNAWLVVDPKTYDPPTDRPPHDR